MGSNGRPTPPRRTRGRGGRCAVRTRRRRPAGCACPTGERNGRTTPRRLPVRISSVFSSHTKTAGGSRVRAILGEPPPAQHAALYGSREFDARLVGRVGMIRVILQGGP